MAAQTDSFSAVIAALNDEIDKMLEISSDIPDPISTTADSLSAAHGHDNRATPPDRDTSGSRQQLQAQQVAPGPAPQSSSVLPTVPNLIDRPDLSGYRLTAIVDWVDVEFSTGTVRSARALQAAVPSCSHVMTLDWERTGSTSRGTRFRARIQNPRRAADIRAHIHSVGGFDLLVTGVELAVDLEPLTAAAKDAMPTMGAHLLRGLQNPMDFARFGRRGAGIDQLQSFDAVVRQFGLGQTCYLGHRGDSHYQRIYLKRTDNGGKPLPESEWRVRIENTYIDRNGLADVVDGDLTQVVGRGDFKFRRVVPSAEGMELLLLPRAVQLGTRASRTYRRVFDRNTKADSVLNDRVYEGLRSLYQRWAVCPSGTEIPGQESSISLGHDAQSNNYTSLTTDCHPPEGHPPSTKVCGSSLETEKVSSPMNSPAIMVMNREGSGEGKVATTIIDVQVVHDAHEGTMTETGLSFTTPAQTKEEFRVLGWATTSPVKRPFNSLVSVLRQSSLPFTSTSEPIRLSNTLYPLVGPGSCAYPGAISGSHATKSSALRHPASRFELKFAASVYTHSDVPVVRLKTNPGLDLGPKRVSKMYALLYTNSRNSAARLHTRQVAARVTKARDQVITIAWAM